MEATLIYILKWALCLAVLYIPFTLLLRRESFASLNRRLLLCVVIVSGMLPAIVVRYKVEIPTEAAIYEKQHISETLHNTILATAPANHYDIFTWENAAILYLAGVAVALLWGVAGVARTIKHINRGTLWTDKQKGITIHCHAGNSAAFSWFGHIVISENDYNECGTEILLHEKGHIHHKHSYDMLLIGVVKALQWFNPFIYMLENDIRELHEYEADRYVLQNHTDTQAYQLLILRKSLGNKAISLVNNFGTSNVRKRIMMMARKKESGALQRAKWAYLIPTAALLMLFFAEPEYIYTTPARKFIATATPVATPKTEITATDKKPQKTSTTQNLTAKSKRLQPIANEAPVQQTTAKSTAETPTVATPPANKEVMQYAHETYYEYKELKEVLTSNDAGVKKCSVRMQFTADKNGRASNITAKGCNISMSIGENSSYTLEDIQATIIAATKQYIESKEWAAATGVEDINTKYDAHIIFHNGTPTTIASNSNKRPLLIGSTPIY